MSKFIEKKVDKFHNKTELVTKRVTLWSASKLYDYSLSWQRNDIKARFRYWSDNEGETILLDVDYGGPDWLYLRNGDIVIRINDTKNIELKPSGEDSEVTSNEGHKIICREMLYYEVKKEDFIDICKATSLEFQISGSRSFVNGKAEKLQAMARVLYDNLYEPIFDTKALEERLASKWKSILSCLFAFPASIAASIFMANAWGYLWKHWHWQDYPSWGGDYYYYEDISSNYDWISLAIVATLGFCVANYFLPYSRKMKWITYALFVIVFIVTCIELW
ncbi:MAG: hypothetical protein PUK04_04870 [Bacteroidales bacterium]|nr:hypothetical protein [Bacteroidales bacterium]MDY4850368.1 hypothetical protein [Paludibacteraceae bacterium]MDY6036430.1 hypothetical protein [Paludibacteraceae bacterium]